MAFGRLERRTARRPMSDINMTPLIDVMLGAAGDFMITAPLMTSSLKLDHRGRCGAAQRHASVRAVANGDRRAGCSIGEESPNAATFAGEWPRRRKEEPQTEGAAARRTGACLRPACRAHRHGAESGPEPASIRCPSRARPQAGKSQRPALSRVRGRAAARDGLGSYNRTTSSRPPFARRLP
jgi:hypothetical protein